MRKTKAKDPEIVEMNAKRAGWALHLMLQTVRVAVEAFAQETGLDRGSRLAAHRLIQGKANEEFETGVYDLIVDIMHLCDVRNLNFAEIVHRARGCYEEEQEEL